MYLGSTEDVAPKSWDPATQSEVDVQAIRSAQMQTEVVYAWGPPFVSLLESLVYSVVATKNRYLSLSLSISLR